MIKQMQYLTLKFESDRLKKFKYDIDITIDEAIRNKEMISTFENQIIDTILEITGRVVDLDEKTNIENNIKRLKGKAKSDENGIKIKQFQHQLNELLFVPEYIIIKMNTIKHYEYLYKKGVTINGREFIRFNSSASQARVNTVLFVAKDIFDELRKRTDNGRDLNKPIAPAKLNAYRGLYGSARRKVSTPRFCVVKDYESESTMTVNFVTETEPTEDDVIDVRTLTKAFNRFDGQGLISPFQAQKWSEEIGLAYTPSQFCIRGSFLKGMLCVFDIHEFVKLENNGNGMIETIYKDENGNSIMVDLNDVDVIITESQLKLWDSWNSVDDYIDNCKKNNMSWGITLFSPEFDKTFMYENYQFLQTLNLDDDDVHEITKKFIRWIKGVSSENVYYTMLFLVGSNTDEGKFLNYLKSGQNHWVKALILEPKLIKDKYIRGKIYNLIKKKVKDASLGQIIVDGNYQVIVSDPYAMMEATCGKKVGGLLAEGEHYSNYWNNSDVKEVVASRSPLTYRSEHVLLNLIKNEKTEKWYKYCKSGIILNIHGDETDRFAGSDFDMDIIATTSDKSVIKGVYRNELPVVYEPPKPKKEVVQEDMLYNADKFSFNSIIGQLTNKSTTGYALLADLKPNTEEFDVTLERIKSITKAQSAQIDKTKIGREVKGIVPKWISYQKANSNEAEDEKEAREFNNRILLDKHPYFFIHLYGGTRKDYKKHLKQHEILSLQRFGVTLNELKSLKTKSEDQTYFLDMYKRTSPVIESDCVMNKICKKIESVDFEIRNLLKTDKVEDLHELFVDDNIEFDKKLYAKVLQCYTSHNEKIRGMISNSDAISRKEFYKENLQSINILRDNLQSNLLEVCSNEDELMNYVIHMFYVDKPSFNKDTMWTLFGDKIVKNLKRLKRTAHIPILDVEGEIEYLNSRYTVKEVSLFNEHE